MKAPLFRILFILFLSSIQCINAKEIKSLGSPDGKLILTLEYSDAGNLSYSLVINDHLIINKSPMGYELENGTPAERNIWKRRVTELCAQNHLLCDFHDGRRVKHYPER